MKTFLELIKAIYSIAEAIKENKNNSDQQGGLDENILIKVANTFVDFDELVYENDGRYYVKKDIKFSDIYNVEPDKVLEFFKYIGINNIENDEYHPLLIRHSIYEEDDIRCEGSNISFVLLEYHIENRYGGLQSNINSLDDLTKDTVIYHKDDEIDFGTPGA